MAPREGEELIRHEDLVAAITAAGDSLALVLWPGVQYYTGQVFDIAGIVAAAHAVGAKVGIDLAHATGNVPLHMHEWGADFAAFCTYKYLNSGPGGIAGAFVHARHAGTPIDDLPYFAGWWGHERESRFKMGGEYRQSAGAARFQLSNPPVLQVASLRCVPAHLLLYWFCFSTPSSSFIHVPTRPVAAPVWTCLTRRAAWRCCAPSRWHLRATWRRCCRAS